MKDLDLFVQAITPYAPGCPAPTAYFGIRMAAIEFCARTRIWRFEDSVTISEASEKIDVPSGSVVTDIEAAWFNGQELKPKTTEYLDQHARGWREGDYTGNPEYITQQERGTFRVVPFVAPGTLRIAVWLKPTQDADQLPDALYDEYREDIAAGAFARILMIPNQSFTNGDMAAVFSNQFQSRIAALVNRGVTGQQRAPVRTKPSFI